MRQNKGPVRDSKRWADNPRAVMDQGLEWLWGNEVFVSSGENTVDLGAYLMRKKCRQRGKVFRLHEGGGLVTLKGKGSKALRKRGITGTRPVEEPRIGLVVMMLIAQEGCGQTEHQELLERKES